MSPKSRRLSIEELKQAVKPIAEKYGVNKIYLFGSVARGDHNENSDYDFCIEAGRIRTLLELSGFFIALKEVVGNEIDIVEKEELESEFLETVMNESVEIYAQ
ncbi:MAG: nucleotidyltransferase domain-containing protein [Methanomassiliicoccaceae archaeon]|nr:nucleotidyltransferase domain-containing protein [Methanomassiliicoccaceae archaeon]